MNHDSWSPPHWLKQIIYESTFRYCILLHPSLRCFPPVHHSSHPTGKQYPHDSILRSCPNSASSKQHTHPIFSKGIYDRWLTSPMMELFPACVMCEQRKMMRSMQQRVQKFSCGVRNFINLRYKYTREVYFQVWTVLCSDSGNSRALGPS